MARSLRIPFENAYYHVTCRGNSGQDIFTAILIGGDVDSLPPPPPLPNPDLKGEWTRLTQVCKNTPRGQNCMVKGTINIQNVGSVDAATSFVRFYLSDDEKYDEGTDIFLK